MIFISYRRSDGMALAQLIQKSLISEGFDKDEVFLDLHSILAEKFHMRCKKAIEECQCFLLLITDDSFVGKKSHDYYYDEIHYALDLNKKIIPIVFNSKFNENVIPEQFKQKELHLTNAIRYDVEFSEASVKKIIDAIDSARKLTFIQKIARAFVIPTLFITIYIIISLVGGVVRYVWDNYWLSEKLCVQSAAAQIREGNDGIYRYAMRDSLYWYNPISGTVGADINPYSAAGEGIAVRIKPSDGAEIGFWSLAVAMVYEISKSTMHYRGNTKQLAVVAAITVSVAAGFGLGFVVERMIFPVHESKLIRKKLHSKEWWDKLIRNQNKVPELNSNF